MKFMVTLMAVAGLAAAAEQQPPVDVIKAQLELVINATAKLTTAINSFRNLSQAAGLLAANQNVLSTVQNGTNTILGLNSQVRLNEALLLTPPVIELRTMVNESITAIIQQKPIFVNQSIASITYGSLQQLNCASEQLNNATNSHLPGGGIGAASTALSAPIFVSFQKGLEAYQDQSGGAASSINCTAVNATSKGLNPLDESGAGMLAASSGLTFMVAAGIATFLML